jgi:hypothetical protein
LCSVKGFILFEKHGVVVAGSDVHPIGLIRKVDVPAGVRRVKISIQDVTPDQGFGRSRS